MKTKFYFPMILSLLVMVMSLFTACSDSDNPLSDTTKPVIDLNSPTEGQACGYSASSAKVRSRPSAISC